MTKAKSWQGIKTEIKEGWKEMKNLTFRQLLVQCVAGFALAMLAGFCLI